MARPTPLAPLAALTLTALAGACTEGPQPLLAPDGLAVRASAGTTLPPTHQMNLFINKMFRDGTLLARDADIGDDDIVVRPLTRRQLERLPDVIVPGAKVLPFDMAESRLGHLEERTIEAFDPSDLAALVEAVRARLAERGLDADDPRDVELGLKLEPELGQVRVILDEGLARPLSTARGAYLGALDQGFHRGRLDLFLREIQKPRVVILNNESTELVRFAVNVIENGDTHVVPADDFVDAGEYRSLLERFDEELEEPRRVVHFLSVPDGFAGVHAEGYTDDMRIVSPYTDRIGEEDEWAAYWAAHFLGHAVLGPWHDRSGDPLSIMQPDPPARTLVVQNYNSLNYFTFMERESQWAERFRKPATVTIE